MSKIKRFYEDRIAILAKATGYDYCFLMDIWNDECENGDADFEYFSSVTLERDW